MLYIETDFPEAVPAPTWGTCSHKLSMNYGNTRVRYFSPRLVYKTQDVRSLWPRGRRGKLTAISWPKPGWGSKSSTL